MSFRDISQLFSFEELKEFIPADVCEYVDKFSNTAMIDFIEKNIIELSNNDNFISKCYKKLVYLNLEMSDWKNILKDDELRKKEILKLFELEYKNEIISKKEYISCLLPNRFYELLDYQFLIKEKVTNYINEKINSGKHINKLIIHMPTGTGKTKTAIHTIISLFQNYSNKGIIVWLAHTDELLEQAYKTFNDIWSVLGNMDIKLFYKDIAAIKESNAIYFISYQKLIKLFKDKTNDYLDFRNNISICVCDEAHKCLADETYHTLEDLMLSYDKTHSKTLIGLTATPGRKYNASLSDDDNLQLALMFDQHIFSINIDELNIFSSDKYVSGNKRISYKNIYEEDQGIISYFQKRGILSKIKRHALDYEKTNIELQKIFNKKREKDYSNSELIKIGNDKIRNVKIIQYLKELDKSSYPTILFVCSNEQGKLMSNVLTLLGVKNNAVFGDTPTKLRKKYIDDFNNGKYNILINNSILTTGFDSPRIRCVFIARPTNSIVLYSQMLGRGLRGPRMGGNEECLLIDIKDNLTKFKDENFAFSYFEEYWR